MSKISTNYKHSNQFLGFFLTRANNLNDINPTITANQRVKNLIIIARTNVACNSKPCNVNKPAKLPSVTPNPPGDIEIDPKIIDAEYIDANWKKSIRFTPIAKKTNEIPIASTIRKSIVRDVHPEIICGVDDFLIISCDCSRLVKYLFKSQSLKK